MLLKIWKWIKKLFVKKKKHYISNYRIVTSFYVTEDGDPLIIFKYYYN